MQSRIMAPLLLVRALVFWVAVGGGTRRGVMSDPNLRQVSETAEACPRCDMIFTMLETNSAGERVQHIEMMERGEGICFEARVLPFDPLIVHANHIRCPCTIVRSTLRRIQETFDSIIFWCAAYKLHWALVRQLSRHW